jgi:hypothetical protein
MSRSLHAVAAVVLVVAAGTVHGLWTNRWGATEELKTAIARLDSVPRSLPGWDPVPTPPLSTNQTGGAAGSFFQRYRKQGTGKIVGVFLLCDLPGLVACHTPDVCYVASGFTISDKQPFRLDADGPQEFLTARFQKDSGGETAFQRIFWSWTNSGPWTTPADPRLTFLQSANSRLLYKIYVTRDLTTGDEPLETDPCVDLLRQLLPELRQKLFPPS